MNSNLQSVRVNGSARSSFEPVFLEEAAPNALQRSCDYHCSSGQARIARCTAGRRMLGRGQRAVRKCSLVSPRMIDSKHRTGCLACPNFDEVRGSISEQMWVRVDVIRG
jgi:hypothetical protein